jgi:hypothetical protein
MKLLDLAAQWIHRPLSWLPDGAQRVLWFPIMVIFVITAVWLIVRKALPLLGRLLGALMRAVGALAGAVLLLPDLLVSTACRLGGVPPPGIVYAYGDAVCSSIVTLESASRRSVTGSQGLSRMNLVFILLLSGVCLWGWNRGHCPGAEPTAKTPACVTPVADWVNGLK